MSRYLCMICLFKFWIQISQNLILCLYNTTFITIILQNSISVFNVSVLSVRELCLFVKHQVVPFLNHLSKYFQFSEKKSSSQTANISEMKSNLLCLLISFFTFAVKFVTINLLLYYTIPHSPSLKPPSISRASLVVIRMHLCSCTKLQ